MSIQTYAAQAHALLVASPRTGGSLEDQRRALLSAAIPLSHASGDPDHMIWETDLVDVVTVRAVTQPMLVPMLPEKPTTDAVVIVIPGGANAFLSFESEGTSVATYLNALGIPAFVLLYRTLPLPAARAEFEPALAAALAPVQESGGALPLPGEDAAMADVQAALDLVAARSAEWGVDAAKTGILGFSAGSIAALNVTLGRTAGTRPAFAGLIYGRMLPVAVPDDAPPAFVAVSSDDPIFAAQGLGLAESWRDAGRNVEAHFYQGGAHGYGMIRRNATSDLWPAQFVTWLAAEGFVPVG